MTKKIVTVVGARPQFIKAAAVSRAIGTAAAGSLKEVLVHTGQHYDENMSKVFFDELDIPRPQYNLEISGGGHGVMTGRMLEAIEAVLLDEKPDLMLIYGDTNSTLAGALSAAKLHIPVAHVEAGLRSFNMRMPEEINRILADRISSLLFCPTETAVANLRREGIEEGVHLVGDVMFDVSLFYRDRALKQSRILRKHGLEPGRYVLATCHRAENTDDPNRLAQIIAALAEIAQEIPVIFPVHPRTHQIIEARGLSDGVKGVLLVEPVSYLDMVALEQGASVICTDSGGVQKEAFFFGVPCVTMRDETEWVELVHAGWNQLAGANAEQICRCVRNAGSLPRTTITSYGNGQAAQRVLALLEHQMSI